MQNYNELKVPELKKLANRELGLKYSQLDKMKKAEILEAFMVSQEPEPQPEPESVPSDLSPRELLSRDVQDFFSKGGEVTSLKPQVDAIREAPTEKSAELNLHKKPAKPKALKAKKEDKVKKPKAPKKARIREQEDVVTLQSIMEEVGITGTQARKKLRASGIAKPGKQWVWKKGDKQVKEVTKLLGEK